MLFFSLPLSRKIEAVQIKFKKILMKAFFRFFYMGVGQNTFLLSPLLITPEFITLGSNVSFRHHARIEGIHSFAGDRYSPEIIIEDGVTFQQRCHITAANRLVIGEGTIASFDVMITDIDHDYHDIDTPVALQPLVIRPTSIGKNCFLGGGVKIQAGTKLGEHCIVGANSVVRGVFPSFSVLAGAPAKIVKRYNFETNTWQKTDSSGDFV